MKRITIKKRANDYIAFISDYPSKWDCGKSPAEAIGKLIINWGNELGLQVLVEE